MNFSLDMGLPAAICATISIGFAGIGQTHTDIAGEYRFPWMKRTKELFMRWTEFAAFTCVMRTHEAKGTSGWTFDSDKETLEHFAKFSHIHSKLKPYFINCIEEYVKTGLPIVRHPYLNYEKDPQLHAKKPRSLQYQYLLGSDLLIAPIFKKNAINRELYLPQDDWIHLWSGTLWHGGWIRISAPLGEPPVFYRQNSEFRLLFEKLLDD
jgi:alpha-glucosidase